MMPSNDAMAAIDQFIERQLVPDDPMLESVLEASRAAGLPAINVAPNQGKLLMIVAQLMGARRILEVGTLGGYSTIWLARGMSAEGRLTSLEFSPRHAEVARQNIHRAGLDERVEVIVGPALETMPMIAVRSDEPFDLVFIDADKENTAAYFDWAVRMSRRGSLIIVDNVIRKGAIIDDNSNDINVQGMRRFFEAAGNDRRVTATALQTVGSKGHDGLAFVIVN